MSIWEEDIREVQRAFESFRVTAKSYEESGSERVSDYWVKVERSEDQGGYEFIGVDGSFIVKSFTFSTLYLARAIAIAPSIGSYRDSRSEILETTSDDMARQHAEAVMAYLEVKTASKALVESVKHDREPILLFDGSLTSLIAHRAILHRSPLHPHLVDYIARELSLLADESDIVFVAKRSSSSLYSGGRLPDMIFFSSMPKGFSRPKVVKITDLFDLPEVEIENLPLTSKLKTVTLSYVRLSDGGPLLKIEVPGIRSEDEVHKIVARLSSVSPAGYPVPLLAAHNTVKLRAITLKRALSLMGIRLPSGREALREVLV